MRRQVPIALLVEDMSVYPRHAVDDSYVGTLVAALRAGSTFPPVVAEEKSLRIVDGWHRLRALRRHMGDDAVADVEVLSYKSEADLLLDAIQRNATHGRKLDKIDQIRCMTLGEERGIRIPLLANVLHIPVEQAQKIRLHIAYATGPDVPGTISGTERVALKRPLRHLDGRHLTDAQVAATLSAPGTSYMLLTNQLISALREHLLNLEDRALVERLKLLRQEIGRAIHT